MAIVPPGPGSVNANTSGVSTMENAHWCVERIRRRVKSTVVIRGSNDCQDDSQSADHAADDWVVGQKVIGPGIQGTTHAEMGEATEGEDPERRDCSHQHRHEEDRVQSGCHGRSQTIQGPPTEQRDGEDDGEWECDEMDHELSFSSAARLAASSGSSPLANPASADARSLVASRSEWIRRAVTSASVAGAR